MTRVTPDDLRAHPPGLKASSSAFALFDSDYRAWCSRRPPEPIRRRRLLAVPRLLVNPTLRALLVLRIANASPRATWWIWRNYFVHLHAIDWSGALEIGPGFELPHPVGVMFLAGSRIGADVGFAHNVTMGGSARGGTTTIGDRVVIFPGVVISGGVTIGDDTVISANCVVARDVAKSKLFTQTRVMPVGVLRNQG